VIQDCCFNIKLTFSIFYNKRLEIWAAHILYICTKSWEELQLTNIWKLFFCTTKFWTNSELLIICTKKVFNKRQNYYYFLGGITKVFNKFQIFVLYYKHRFQQMTKLHCVLQNFSKDFNFFVLQTTFSTYSKILFFILQSVFFN